jgi:hypothetical protein
MTLNVIIIKIKNADGIQSIIFATSIINLKFNILINFQYDKDIKTIAFNIHTSNNHLNIKKLHDFENVTISDTFLL